MRHDPFQISGGDDDVRVVDEKEVMAGLGRELDQGADLAVGSEHRGAPDQLNGMSGKLSFELLYGGDGGVGERGYPKEQFDISAVGLAAVASEGFDHAGVKAFERLEDAYSGRKVRQRGAPVGKKDACGHHGGQEVAHASHRQYGGEELYGLGENV